MPPINGSVIRVVVAKQEVLLREALATLLTSTPGLEVVGQADPEDAPRVARTSRADVVVVVTAEHGVAVAQAMAGVPTRVLVVGSAPVQASRVLAAGAAGFLDATADAAELISAITRVHAGHQVAPAVVEEIGPDPARVLSPRELETLRMLAAGLTNREIAQRLGISVKTIDTHRGHALKKLGLRNNADLTRFAIQHQLVDLSARTSMREQAA